MRRQINLLVLAVSLLVVFAFVVPIALLVRAQAANEAKVEVERDVQRVAAVLVQAAASAGSLDLVTLADPPQGNLAVIAPGGQVIGDLEPNRFLISETIDGGEFLSTTTGRGHEIALPVTIDGETVVVTGLADSEALTSGVWSAWRLLALLGLAVTGISLAVADRLGRTVRGPADRLAAAARRLGEGDLETTVAVEGPDEMQAIATAFNLLATRVQGLVDTERESAADLSHRLRTPLTALRLEIETVGSADDRARVSNRLARLEQEVDQLIAGARHQPDEEPDHANPTRVISERAAFWALLARSERRFVDSEIQDTGDIAASPAELGAVVDALIGNVFRHTPEGTTIQIRVSEHRNAIYVEIGDGGEGFEDLRMAQRGVSGGGSTGLGLDIAHRLAENLGGTLFLGSSELGGALVRLTLPASETERSSD